VLQDDPSNEDHASLRRGVLRVPLFRLLAINPGGLRHLIFADASPGTALGLLLFGFVVTFGSAAMGTAVMAMGRASDDRRRRGPPLLPAPAMIPPKRRR